MESPPASPVPLVPVAEMNARWAAILRGERPPDWPHRLCRHLFALIPSPWRCKFCNAPFHGPAAGSLKWLGLSPSRKNPHVCARCIEYAPDGGAIVPLSVLFADVRGYTALAERLPAIEVTALLNRFYTTASKALLAHQALLAQIAGDEVMALFVPGFAGSRYPERAVEAGRVLLRSLGYDTQGGPWLDVGVGICSGEAFAGNVGGGGFKDFTALGDVTNTAARLTATAKGGELLVCEETYRRLSAAYPGADRRELALKGKAAPVACYRIPATA